MTTHSHHLIARTVANGPDEYLNVAGSWHAHPALATAFFGEMPAAAALEWVKRREKPRPGQHYAVVPVRTQVAAVQRVAGGAHG